MDKRDHYKRRDDMSPNDTLELLFEEDGDIIIAIKKPDMGRAMNVQFCSIGNGGGRSRHTLKTLTALAKAMEKDNKEKPIH